MLQTHLDNRHYNTSDSTVMKLFPYLIAFLFFLLNPSYSFGQNSASSIIVQTKHGPQLNYAIAANCSYSYQQSIELPNSKDNQLLSFVGDLKTEFRSIQTQIDSSSYELFRAADVSIFPLEKLDSIIGNDSLILINEAHDRLVQRAFLYQLLPLLKEKGFTHIAMETFAAPSGELSISTGFYTAEPLMGEVYRRALALGFDFIRYEDTLHNSLLRDSLQAVNLKNNLFDNGKWRKTLVICGYGHLYETSDSRENKMMGEYISELTGVDPLTIDQVLFGEYDPNSYSHSIYEALHQDVPILVSQIEFWPFADFCLVHPPTQFINNRPDCILLNDKKHFFEFSDYPRNTRLAQVYLADEIKSKRDFQTRIPTDQTTYFKNGIFMLALDPAETYLLVYRNKKNRILRIKKIKPTSSK